MQVINTNGMAIIGPGSEWLWSAVSGLVLAATFVAIWRQLRLQSSAAAIEQMRSLLAQFESEQLARCRVEVLLAITAGAGPGELPPSVERLFGFYDFVGDLTRRRHLDRETVYELFSRNVQLWWGWLASCVERERDEEHEPLLWSGFEWLATFIREEARRRGDYVMDDAMREATLPLALAGAQSTVRIAEESRRVSVLGERSPTPSAP